jgi:hypothetical protein
MKQVLGGDTLSSEAKLVLLQVRVKLMLLMHPKFSELVSNIFGSEERVCLRHLVNGSSQGAYGISFITSSASQSAGMYLARVS